MIEQQVIFNTSLYILSVDHTTYPKDMLPKSSQPATVQQKNTPKLRPQLNGALLKASDGSANPQRFIKE